MLNQSTTLARINLARNPLGDIGLASLASLPWLRLSHLDLRACGLAAEGINSLSEAAESGGLNALCMIDLSNNALGPGSGVGLARLLGGSPALGELKLSSCNLGDEGVMCLAEGLALHRGNLHTLNISDNGFGDMSG